MLQLAFSHITVFPPSKAHDVHRHPAAEEFLFVLEGSGLHLSERGPIPLAAGEVAYIPQGEWHGFANDSETPTTVVTVLAGISSYEDAGYEVLPEPSKGRRIRRAMTAEAAHMRAVRRLRQSLGFKHVRSITERRDVANHAPKA